MLQKHPKGDLESSPKDRQALADIFYDISLTKMDKAALVMKIYQHAKYAFTAYNLGRDLETVQSQKATWAQLAPIELNIYTFQSPEYLFLRAAGISPLNFDPTDNTVTKTLHVLLEKK